MTVAATPSALREHPAAGRKAAPRPVPSRSDDYAHLTLDGLRAYRAALQSEEGKVSYWRRIIQARLDVVRAGTLAAADNSHLRPVLATERVGAGRQALVEIVPIDDIPPLPDLGELWDRQVDEDDAAAVGQLDHDLSVAEVQLSAYRQALHRRISEATGELIARYRENPSLCLSALPVPPASRAIPA